MTQSSTLFVRPDVQAFLSALEAAPRPPLTAELLALLRASPTDPALLPDLPPADVAVKKTVIMPGPGGALELTMFDARAERESGPVMVFYHGGGFVIGGLNTHSGMIAELARGLDLPVISVDYRLAPEHKWPAAPDDAEAAARWIAENGAAFDRRFTGLVLCGDSAGGNLTIVASMALRDRPAALQVILQIAIYPLTDHANSTPSRAAFGKGYALDTEGMVLFDAHYAADPSHWRASPLIADQSGMPPTLVITAALDPLRDEGRAYAAKMIEAGVSTTYREVGGTIHGFATYRRVIPSARADLAALIEIARVKLREAQA